MNFALTAEQEQLRDAVVRLCERFGDDYWLAKDRDGGFPHDFHQAFAAAGWLGIAMPEEYGGAGLGITEAGLMLQTIAETGAGFSGCSALHMNIFGLNPVVVFGTDEQKRRMLPPLIAGEHKACFAVTEPDAGLDTLNLKTRAERRGGPLRRVGPEDLDLDRAGRAQDAPARRTTPAEQVARRTEGLTLFYTDLDRRHVEVREIDKMGRMAVDSNQLFLDGLPVRLADRIGEEGRGFDYILHGMNPERILVGAEAVGLGRAALARASRLCQGERVVFGRPIGKNQAIQHPPRAQLDGARGRETSWCSRRPPSTTRDARAAPRRTPRNSSAPKPRSPPAQTAVTSHGGMGYAREFHVERYLREAMIARLAPVSAEMILNFIGEKVLGLPRSY